MFVCACTWAEWARKIINKNVIFAYRRPATLKQAHFTSLNEFIFICVDSCNGQMAVMANLSFIRLGGAMGHSDKIKDSKIDRKKAAGTNISHN